MHIEAEQVLDPVVGVGPSAWRGTHLRQPGPYVSGRGADLDHAGRNAIGILEQLVPRKTGCGLRFGCAPGEDRLAQQCPVEHRGDSSQGGDDKTRPHGVESFNPKLPERPRSTASPASIANCKAIPTGRGQSVDGHRAQVALSYGGDRDIERVGDEPPSEEGRGQRHEGNGHQAGGDEKLSRRQRRKGKEPEPGCGAPAVGGQGCLGTIEALQPSDREARPKPASAVGQQKAPRCRGQRAAHDQRHCRQVEIEPEEDQQRPGWRAECREKVDAEDNPKRNCVLGRDRHRTYRSPRVTH